VSTIAELRKTELRGYRKIKPYARARRYQGAANDLNCCDGLTCEQCGRRGWLECQMFTGHPEGYLAYAVCPDCGHAHLIDPGEDYWLGGA